LKGLKKSFEDLNNGATIEFTYVILSVAYLTKIYSKLSWFKEKNKGITTTTEEKDTPKGIMNVSNR
jgi:hypothetical protein